MHPCPSCCFPNSDQARLCGHCGLYLKAIGDYVLVERIGTGGFAEVYRAVNRYTGHSAAIKVLHRKLIHDREIEQRFLREVEILRDLRSPNVVQIYDFGVLEDMGLFLVMEWLDGETLDLFVHRHPNRRLPIAEVIPLFTQLLYGLSRIHGKQVVHRDLKPKNFMVVHEKDKRVLKILDFGIAWVPGGLDLTERGMFVGSTYFMAPEQFKAQKGLFGPSTDLYVAGQLLVWMVTGKHVFTANTLQALAVRHCCESPPSLAALCPDLSFPPALEELVARALEKKPPGRFQTALAFLDAFQQAVPLISPVHTSAIQEPESGMQRPGLAGMPAARTAGPPPFYVQGPRLAGAPRPLLPMRMGGQPPIQEGGPPQAALMLKERMKWARSPQANATPSYRPSSFEGALSPPSHPAPSYTENLARIHGILATSPQQKTPSTSIETPLEQGNTPHSPSETRETMPPLSTFRRKTNSMPHLPSFPLSSTKKRWLLWSMALMGAGMLTAGLAFFWR